jgi:hypothetical protein
VLKRGGANEGEEGSDSSDDEEEEVCLWTYLVLIYRVTD